MLLALLLAHAASGCGLVMGRKPQPSRTELPEQTSPPQASEAGPGHCKLEEADGGAPAYHVMRRGDTLYSVARLYGVKLSEILALNPISDPTSIPVGKKIVLPPTARSPWGGVRLSWPVRGTVTSRFKQWGRRHDGIDIAAPRGTPIKAAASGVVDLSGMGLDGFSGYGRIVVIRHGGGLRTLYAHASRVFVRRGQCVAKGQVIAAVGSSGNATGPHLHFEVRRFGRPVDPFYFLP